MPVSMFSGVHRQLVNAVTVIELPRYHQSSSAEDLESEDNLGAFGERKHTEDPWNSQRTNRGRPVVSMLLQPREAMSSVKRNRLLDSGCLKVLESADIRFMFMPLALVLSSCGSSANHVRP